MRKVHYVVVIVHEGKGNTVILKIQYRNSISVKRTGHYTTLSSQRTPRTHICTQLRAAAWAEWGRPWPRASPISGWGCRRGRAGWAAVGPAATGRTGWCRGSRRAPCCPESSAWRTSDSGGSARCLQMRGEEKALQRWEGWERKMESNIMILWKYESLRLFIFSWDYSEDKKSCFFCCRLNTRRKIHGVITVKAKMC